MLAESIKDWFAEAARKGREQGLQQGMQAGESRVVARLLTRRFGELPAWVEDRLAKATQAELDAWADALLDARNLTQVFTEPPLSHGLFAPATASSCACGQTLCPWPHCATGVLRHFE